jgi:hypothetical protein
MSRYLPTDDGIWQIWIGRLTFHMDESSNALQKYTETKTKEKYAVEESSNRTESVCFRLILFWG